jgi:hypothetical protein
MKSRKNVIFIKEAKNIPAIYEELTPEFNNFTKNYVNDGVKGDLSFWSSIKNQSMACGLGASGNSVTFIRGFAYRTNPNHGDGEITVSSVEMTYRQEKKGYKIRSARLLEDFIITQVSTPPANSSFAYNPYAKLWETKRTEKRNIPIVYNRVLKKWHNKR